MPRRPTPVRRRGVPVTHLRCELARHVNSLHADANGRCTMAGEVVLADDERRNSVVRVCWEHYDSCARCHGTRGGEVGNSVIVNDEPICDYCHADDLILQREERERIERQWTCATCSVSIFAEEAHVIVVPADDVIPALDRAQRYHVTCYSPLDRLRARDERDEDGPRRIVL